MGTRRRRSATRTALYKPPPKNKYIISILTIETPSTQNPLRKSPQYPTPLDTQAVLLLCACAELGEAQVSGLGFGALAQVDDGGEGGGGEGRLAVEDDGLGCGRGGGRVWVWGFEGVWVRDRRGGLFVRVELNGDGGSEAGVSRGGFARGVAACFFLGLEEAVEIFCGLLPR